jgi:hypothetical protein
MNAERLRKIGGADEHEVDGVVGRDGVDVVERA